MSSSRALRNSAIDLEPVHLELTINPNHPQTPTPDWSGHLPLFKGRELPPYDSELRVGLG